MSDIILRSSVEENAYTDAVEKLFGLKTEGESIVTIKDNIALPKNWNIGLLHGPSGSGKSTLLKKFGNSEVPTWNEKSIISNFTNLSPEQATSLLTAVGFSSVPAWLRPFNCLSVGEQFRANLAKTLSEDRDVYVIDEFTSVVDRNVAKSVSNVLAKFIRRSNKKVVLASCHSDILEYLQPDWYYNPAEGETHTGSDSLQRSQISLEIVRCKQSAWNLFKDHHFLDTTLNQGARCFLALWDGAPVAFSACLSLPHPTIGYAWRATRTVVLPDYQGLGFGVRLTDYVASMAKAVGVRFYSKTVHPAMVAYRQKSPLWRETENSGRVKKNGHGSKTKRTWNPVKRKCFSFEYIGPASSDEEAKLFWDDSSFAGRKKRKKIRLGLVNKGQTVK